MLQLDYPARGGLSTPCSVRAAPPKDVQISADNWGYRQPVDKVKDAAARLICTLWPFLYKCPSIDSVVPDMKPYTSSGHFQLS